MTFVYAARRRRVHSMNCGNGDYCDIDRDNSDENDLRVTVLRHRLQLRDRRQRRRRRRRRRTDDSSGFAGRKRFMSECMMIYKRRSARRRRHRHHHHHRRRHHQPARSG